jgi:hypothetical protein
VLKEPVEQVRKYIAEYDLDKDGNINYEVRWPHRCEIRFLSSLNCVPVAGIHAHGAPQGLEVQNLAVLTPGPFSCLCVCVCLPRVSSE